MTKAKVWTIKASRAGPYSTTVSMLVNWHTSIKTSKFLLFILPCFPFSQQLKDTGADMNVPYPYTTKGPRSC